MEGTRRNRDNRAARQSRRGFLTAASTVVAASLVAAAPARAAPSRYASGLRFLVEGEVRADWVLSLLPFPVVPGLVANARYQFPAPEPAHAGKDVMSVLVYFMKGPSVIPLSAFHVAIDDVVLATAAFAGADNPAENVLVSGHVVDYDDTSLAPFGNLVGRALALSFGFEWEDDRHSAAIFKLVAGSAAGSHATVVPQAEGYLEIGRPWHAF